MGLFSLKFEVQGVCFLKKLGGGGGGIKYQNILATVDRVWRKYSTCILDLKCGDRFGKTHWHINSLTGYGIWPSLERKMPQNLDMRIGKKTGYSVGELVRSSREALRALCLLLDPALFAIPYHQFVLLDLLFPGVPAAQARLAFPACHLTLECLENRDSV